MTSSISYLGQHKAQTQRLLDLRAQLADLQRQLTTQKKTDTMSGHGADATRIQRLRAETSQAQSFIQNIDILKTRATLMSDAMEQAADLARRFGDALPSATLPRRKTGRVAPYRSVNRSPRSVRTIMGAPLSRSSRARPPIESKIDWTKFSR